MSELNKYIEYFSNLKRAPWDVVPEISKGSAPHKPLLLLALIDLVESGSIRSSFIDINSDLERLTEQFKAYWGRVVPPGQTSSIIFPILHLHSEPFWKLQSATGAEIDIRSISTINQLKSLVVGAQIDENLFQLMQQSDGRSQLRRVLLKSCFSENAQKELSKQIFLNRGRNIKGDSRMSELLEALKKVFPGYLKQFIERAKLDNPSLSQIPIPDDLARISAQLGVSFKTSFGQGVATFIPWLACFLPNQSASVEGVYPVILYRKDRRVVTVNYGVSATAQKTDGNWPKRWPSEMVSGLQHFPDKKYDESFLYKSFDSSQLYNLEGIIDSFIKVIEDFLNLHANIPVKTIIDSPPKLVEPKILMPMTDNINGIYLKCFHDFKSVNLRLQEATVLRYVSSLLTKRFVILTGLSGSGKTKLAHAFASWISKTSDQYRLVAVGADWTSNENVLGFQDALQPTVYRKPVSGALDLILSAEIDPARPYFLILDEMNLSHVERYFADILSAIESGQEIALHSADKKLGSFTGDQLPVPAKIRLPENLFVVGTVNIDETTYMFSPKVLDRANVIEFRATAEDIAGFLDAPGKVDMDTLAGKGAEFGQAFVNAAQLRRSLTDLPAEIFNGTAAAADLKQRLTELFGELAPIGAEFGFRTAFEISSFFYHHAVLTGNGWQFNDALDAQIIQKLMPKLHGSDRKLRPTLTKLKSFCEAYTLPLSLAKVDRMLERLTQDGFTSFAEA